MVRYLPASASVQTRKQPTTAARRAVSPTPTPAKPCATATAATRESAPHQKSTRAFTTRRRPESRRYLNSKAPLHSAKLRNGHEGKRAAPEIDQGLHDTPQAGIPQVLE